MPNSPLDDAVARQYEQWVYPEPIRDLPGWLAGNWEWFDPSHAHRVLWPDREYDPRMDILVAGCGANQAAVIAHTNPRATVVAIDVSQSSLDHQQHLKEVHGLDNLELLLLPIEDAPSLGRDFDLVMSTGVLHHMADPDAGAAALAACLRPHGVLALMLYAHYGRVGVEMLASAFTSLGLGQDAHGLEVVKEAIASVPPDHPVRAYMEVAPDLAYDAGVVDTFLHGRQRSYTVDDCLRLIAGAGLVFQDWFLKAPYYPHPARGNAFSTAVRALPVQQQWSVMEMINSRNACHFLMACRPDRPAASYRIDFASDVLLTGVPMLRYRCVLNGSDLSRPGWTVTLDDAERAVVARIDGRRTVAEVATDSGVAQSLVRDILQALWQLDFLSLAMTAPGTDGI